MSYTPDPQDQWGNWDTPTVTAPRGPQRTAPLGVYGQRPPAPSRPTPEQAPRKAPRNSMRGRSNVSRRRLARWAVLAIVVALLVTLVLFANRALAFGSAISPQSPLSTQTGYVSGVDRVNVVVLGYGGAGHDGAYLSDSLMVMSLVPGDHATTLISVPRDIWVQVPPNSGQYGKINTAFQDGMTNGYGNFSAGQMAGGLEAAAKVSDVTGLNVPYFMSINFQGFRALVDSLGGVDVTVPTAFTARYPINDDPQINAGWKVIHFNAGPQHMTGEQAIEYARARYVLSPASEGSDFARSVRQQLLIHAIADRLRSPTAWPGFSNAMDALQKAIYTNLSLADLSAYVLKLDLSHAKRIGLSNANVLTDSTSSDGQSILLPQNGDWNAVKQYVSSGLAQ